MRITGGKLCRRTVKCPDGIIRPAMDKMRESVFAALGNMAGKSFLDLFSGSGTIAIEAVSRGATCVELCEKDRLKAKTVLENVQMTETELGIKIRCHFMPVEYFVKRCKSQFDYIFLDPPFSYGFHCELISTIAKKKMLLQHGTLLVHRPSECVIPDTIQNLIRLEERVYGRSIVDFYGYK